MSVNCPFSFHFQHSLEEDLESFDAGSLLNMQSAYVLTTNLLINNLLTYNSIKNHPEATAVGKIQALITYQRIIDTVLETAPIEAFAGDTSWTPGPKVKGGMW